VQLIDFFDRWGSSILIYGLGYLMPSYYLVKLINRGSYYAHDNQRKVTSKRQTNRRRSKRKRPPR
jgi:hypothetical protein